MKYLIVTNDPHLFNVKRQALLTQGLLKSVDDCIHFNDVHQSDGLRGPDVELVKMSDWRNTRIAMCGALKTLEGIWRLDRERHAQTI